MPVDAPSVVDTPWPEIRRVLVATDFSAPATAAIRQAYGLVAATGGEITLLHVLSPPSPETNEEACLALLRAAVPARPPPAWW